MACLVTLPIGAYVAGAMLAARPDPPAQPTPIVVTDQTSTTAGTVTPVPDATGPPGSEPSDAARTGSDRDRDDDRDADDADGEDRDADDDADDDVDTVNPRPDDVVDDEHGGGDHHDHDDDRSDRGGDDD